MELTRIKLIDVLDERFCIIDEKRLYRNRDYRSLVVIHTGIRIYNLLEVRNRAVRDKLRFRYTDDTVQRPAVSMTEHHMSQLSFGWCDVRKGASWLVIDLNRIGMTAARLAKWLQANLVDDALALEGNTLVRISFARDDDFLLTKLQFS